MKRNVLLTVLALSLTWLQGCESAKATRIEINHTQEFLNCIADSVEGAVTVAIFDQESGQIDGYSYPLCVIDALSEWCAQNDSC